MSVQSYDLHGVRVPECAAVGPPIRSDHDAVHPIAASARAAALIVIPTERLGDDFFRLKTTTAGELFQKFLTYRLRIVVVGDIYITFI